jgi:hypothetical protein
VDDRAVKLTKHPKMAHRVLRDGDGDGDKGKERAEIPRNDAPMLAAWAACLPAFLDPHFRPMLTWMSKAEAGR